MSMAFTSAPLSSSVMTMVSFMGGMILPLCPQCQSHMGERLFISRVCPSSSDISSSSSMERIVSLSLKRGGSFSEEETLLLEALPPDFLPEEMYREEKKKSGG